MAVIDALRTYLATYSGLSAGAPLWVGYLGPEGTEYAIIPLAGDKITERYINGSSLREFPFAFQSMESTADNLARLEAIGFYEAFADWMESQSDAGTLPSLGTKKTAERIEANGWGYLFEQGQSDTGIYQITCRLIYKQDP